MAAASSSSSALFASICLLHSAVAITCGALMMFYLNEVAVFSHGRETAQRLQGSTPHDQLLIQTSDSFAGLLLFAVGLLLFMVAFVKDRTFQTFFAKGCVLLHASTALWRIYFERRLEDLARDWPRQVVGDVILSLSWIIFLIYTWREKSHAVGWIWIQCKLVDRSTFKCPIDSIKTVGPRRIQVIISRDLSFPWSFGMGHSPQKAMARRACSGLNVCVFIEALVPGVENLNQVLYAST